MVPACSLLPCWSVCHVRHTPSWPPCIVLSTQRTSPFLKLRSPSLFDSWSNRALMQSESPICSQALLYSANSRNNQQAFPFMRNLGCLICYLYPDPSTGTKYSLLIHSKHKVSVLLGDILKQTISNLIKMQRFSQNKDWMK